MGCRVTVLCFYLVFATVQAIEVNLTNVWKQNVGWEISCSWVIPDGDSLQSVTLYRNNRQLLIYKPEAVGGSKQYSDVEDMIGYTTNCAIPEDDQQKGSCVLTLELYREQRDNITISCEVSGERPYFVIERKDIVVENFVPPTDAVVAVGSLDMVIGIVSLNCTASGVPTPSLSWTIGDKNIYRDDSGGAWNAKSKLWRAWSVVSYPPSSNVTVVCTPEINRADKLVRGHAAEYSFAKNIEDLNTAFKLVRGHAAEYSSAKTVEGVLENMIIAVVSLILLK